MTSCNLHDNLMNLKAIACRDYGRDRAWRWSDTVKYGIYPLARQFASNENMVRAHKSDEPNLESVLRYSKPLISVYFDIYA